MFLPVVVVADKDTLVRVVGPSGCACLGAVDVGVVVVLPGVGLPLLPPRPRHGGGGGVSHAGVQAGALVSESQGPVRVGEVVEEDPAGDSEAHGAQ